MLKNRNVGLGKEGQGKNKATMQNNDQYDINFHTKH